MTRVAIVHDYLSGRGGAERVVVSMTRAFPGAAVHTSFYLPERYPELASVRVVPSAMNRLRPLAHHYRAALPVLPWVFGRLRVTDADVVLCSSSGWAHGAATDAPKVVYCHNPARWLYQRDDHASTRRAYRAAGWALDPWLRRWDQRAAASCVRYLANSSSVAARIGQVYGRDAEVVPPPSSFRPDGPQEPIDGVPEGFVLAAGRLLGYKGIAEVVEAFRSTPAVPLLVAGGGPLERSLRRIAPANVTIAGEVGDAQLRWAYTHAVGLVSASREDFGLTPVEAAACGTPSVLLRAGGFRDTLVEGVNGVFFEEVTAPAIAGAVRSLLATRWDAAAIRRSADRFSEESFSARLHAVVAEVHGLEPDR